MVRVGIKSVYCVFNFVDMDLMELMIWFRFIYFWDAMHLNTQSQT